MRKKQLYKSEERRRSFQATKNEENNAYSNSKSLLEILSDVDKSKPSTNVKIDNKEESENIFSNKSLRLLSRDNFIGFR